MSLKVTHVSLRPTEAAQAAGRPELTPELLAASGARYSRSNEGLEAILSKIDPLNLDKSVDSIFRMIDYGHQSIADMVPVAMFMDGISQYLAYLLWSLCPLAGGQESSTRYIRLDPGGVIDGGLLGIAKSDRDDWNMCNEVAFAAYNRSLEIWQRLGDEHPELMRLPRSILEDTSEKGLKQLDRMKRNYAFDRSRYFLPLGVATNVMMVMSAREWAKLSSYLLSHPLPEANRLGEAILAELELAAPRMLRHAGRKDDTAKAIMYEFERSIRIACNTRMEQRLETEAFLEVSVPEVREGFDLEGSSLAWALDFHSNRYAPVGSDLARIQVRFGWNAVALAEIRDLNRHRTGTKYCPLVPRGFYSATDQYMPENGPNCDTAELENLWHYGYAASQRAYELLKKGDPSYVYWTLLGTQYPFEHSTAADKFVYEAELRTGTGAHFRYAAHLRQVMDLWFERFPETGEGIQLGEAEPE